MNQQQIRKIIAFDFDQTLSVVHLFKSLSGWGQSFVPGPYGASEYGHIHKIVECNKYAWQIKNDQISQVSTTPLQNTDVQFSKAVLGGDERIQELEKFFKNFTELNCLVIVITRGYVGTVNKILADVGLDQYFSGVFGNIEFSYGKNKYDEEAVQHNYSQFIKGKPSQLNTSKGNLLTTLRNQQKLSGNDVILIDDDNKEIEDAQYHKCSGLLVQERKGVTSKQLDMVLQWASQQQQ